MQATGLECLVRIMRRVIAPSACSQVPPLQFKDAQRRPVGITPDGAVLAVQQHPLAQVVDPRLGDGMRCAQRARSTGQSGSVPNELSNIFPKFAIWWNPPLMHSSSRSRASGLPSCHLPMAHAGPHRLVQYSPSARRPGSSASRSAQRCAQA